LEKNEVKVKNKKIIKEEEIIVKKELGKGEFGVVKKGVWKNDGERIKVDIK
jgi:predicted Ser/Thr protein kinase